jgi:hypothetical protein
MTHIASTMLFLVFIDFHNFAKMQRQASSDASFCIAGIEAVTQTEDAPLRPNGGACSALLVLLELVSGQHDQAAVTLGPGARGVVEHVVPFMNVFKTANFAMWGGQAVKDWPR